MTWLIFSTIDNIFKEIVLGFVFNR